MTTTRKMTPEKKLEVLRSIVAHRQNAKVAGIRVDLFSASAIVQVYDVLNDTNKARFLALPVPKMADVAFKIINQRSAA